MHTRVCIITTAHSPEDPRILVKQAQTLSRSGAQVILIAQRSEASDVAGVEILPLPNPPNRMLRVLALPWCALRRAIQERADVYHFHDPELIPAMLVLRLIRRVPIIYDIHEDYVTSIKQKAYLPKLLRWPLRVAMPLLERIGARAFTVIIAESYYAERFPRSTPILNYPTLASESMNEDAVPECTGKSRVIYTGNVTEDRGALIHAGMVHLLPNLHVYLIGRCPSLLASKLQRVVSPYDDRLHLEGVGSYVPHTRIQTYYSAGGWTAGLALFPPTEHYRRKELTKLFEYMAAGMPVVCSAFPAWQAIVEGSKCGLTVDPTDPEAITRAIDYLVKHPEEAKRMGENGRRAVEEKYNWEAEATKLLGLYEVLLKGSR